MSRLRSDHRGLPPISVAAALAATLPLAGLDLWNWVRVAITSYTGNDFHLYYVGAQVASRDGWPAIYERHVYGPAVALLSGRPEVYLSPPPLLWLAGPLTALPYRPAFLVWSLFLTSCFVAAWAMSVTGSRLIRVAHLIAAIGLFPVSFALLLGQATVLVFLAVAAAAWLLRRDRQVAAGLVLALVVVKPQGAVLVPIALAMTGRWRALAINLGSWLLLAGISVALIGADGVRAYLDSLATISAWWFVHVHTLAHVLSPLPAPAVQAAAVAVTLVAAWRNRAAGTDRLLAISVAGSLLGASYLNQEDLALLLLSGWLLLRGGARGWEVGALLAGYLALEAVNLAGPAPALLLCLALLLALAIVPARDQGSSSAVTEVPSPAA